MEAFCQSCNDAPELKVPENFTCEFTRSGWGIRNDEEGHFMVRYCLPISARTVLMKASKNYNSVSRYIRRDLVGNCVMLKHGEESVIISLLDIPAREELVLHSPCYFDSPRLWKWAFPSSSSNVTLCIYLERKKQMYVGLEWVKDTNLPLHKIWSIDTELGLHDSKTYGTSKPIYFLVEMPQRRVGKVKKRDKGRIFPLLGNIPFKTRPLRTEVEKLLTSKLSEWAPLKQQ